MTGKPVSFSYYEIGSPTCAAIAIAMVATGEPGGAANQLANTAQAR
jgi:hypothetical protein